MSAPVSISAPSSEAYAQNAIRSPSGDQTGSKTSTVDRSTVVTPEPATCASANPPMVETTMVEPSGDHSGFPLTPMLVALGGPAATDHAVSWVRPVPSGLMVYIQQAR